MRRVPIVSLMIALGASALVAAPVLAASSSYPAPSGQHEAGSSQPGPSEPSTSGRPSQSPPTVPSGKPSSEASSPPRPTGSGSPKSPENLAQLRARADQEIDQRLASLNKLKTTTSGDGYFTAADKAQLAGEVNNEISGLTALRAKLDADTTVQAMRADAENTYAGFRVYGVVLPKIELVRGADTILWHCANKLNAMPAQVSAVLAKLPDSSSATGRAQPLLDDIHKQATAACDNAKAARDEVIGLAPAGYPGNESAIKDAYSKLKAAHAALKQLSVDFKQVLEILRSVEPTSNPSEHPKATPGTGTRPSPTRS